jgi:hypothetical protein
MCDFHGHHDFIRHYREKSLKMLLFICCDPPCWGLSEGLTTPHRKIPACYEMLHTSSEAGSCEHGNEPSGS